jgi:hypothetical protein
MFVLMSSFSQCPSFSNIVYGMMLTHSTIH